MCWNLLKYVVPTSTYGLDMVHAKFKCPSMDTARYVVLSTKKYSVHAHFLACLNLVWLSDYLDLV